MRDALGGSPRVAEATAQPLDWAPETELGEGPIWDPMTGRLHAVDASRGAVLTLDCDRRTVERRVVGELVGSVFPTESGRLIAAERRGLLLLDGVVEEFLPMEAPGTHLNDGACDRAGRLWIGTVVDGGRRPQGRLLRVEADGRVVTMLADIGLSNGLAWSSDDRRAYLVDSALGRIYVFGYDLDSGELETTVEFVSIPRSRGLPDGLAVDEEDHVWVAIWGGGEVLRFDPDGQVDMRVRVPVSQVTSCAFGGPDLRDLYISASSGFFVCRPGPRGLRTHRFAL